MMHWIKKIALNLVFYPLLVIFTVGSVCLLLLPVTISRVLAGDRFVRGALRWIARYYGLIVVRVLTWPFVRVEYTDLDSVRDPGPSVYVSNHPSFSDGFLVAHLNTEGVQVVNRWPFRIPILGIVARLAEYPSVNEMSFEVFAQKCCALLRQGVSIVAFPEGTRSGNRILNTFHGSVFRVAQMMQCPIVPLCIMGNEKIPARGSWVLNPGVVKITKLPAVHWQEYKDWPPFVFKNKIRDLIQNQVRQMEMAC